MNRKEFLLSMMALGGTALASSANISHWEKVADQVIAEGVEASRKGRRRVDPTKAVLMSDIHICGELVDGVSKHYPYNPTSLKLRVAEILSMRRLPAHVLVFGDVAWDYGLEEDYRYASQLLQELMEAGIRVTLALGNHDRLAPFFKVFPEIDRIDCSIPQPGKVLFRLRETGFIVLGHRYRAAYVYFHLNL
jgi:3',5'-cyclic AMP phosphodiesterase CpdA